jgi:hypothetical protein
MLEERGLRTGILALLVVSIYGVQAANMMDIDIIRLARPCLPVVIRIEPWMVNLLCIWLGDSGVLEASCPKIWHSAVHEIRS